MLYIKQNLRSYFNSHVIPDNCGELNYLITKAIHSYIGKKGLSYSTLNEVMGVLECCKLELNRQVIAPYENEKKKENGPVSELDKRL